MRRPDDYFKAKKVILEVTFNGKNLKWDLTDIAGITIRNDGKLVYIENNSHQGYVRQINSEKETVLESNFVEGTL
jgi:DNA-binding beta-propeller fold protein YncE